MVKKVLIIEDDANILYSLEAQFGINGFQTVTHNGAGEIKDVIDLFRTENANFIVLDLLLPGFDGYDVAYKLQEDEMIQAPIFIFSSMNNEETKQKLAKLTDVYFFPKNELSIDEFTAKVIKIVNNIEKIKK
jgi:DNA-binding response OmpR family regulator